MFNKAAARKDSRLNLDDIDRYWICSRTGAPFLEAYQESRRLTGSSDDLAKQLRFHTLMQAVNRVFAVGRTLGVHMILLTQKPAGVVDDKMNANTRFRWCLKVANAADSREMLHHTDAAQITTPGRAYVQVGEDESLLDAIERAGVAAPCLCRGGACGVCATPLLEGDAEHRDHFLSPTERESGRLIMPCVSRARSGRLVLDL